MHFSLSTGFCAILKTAVVLACFPLVRAFNVGTDCVGVTDADVLSEIYTTMNGPYWLDRVDGWSGSIANACSGPENILCVGGRVTEIRFQNFQYNISGPIPEKIACLTELKKIIIDNAVITDVPESLSLLSKLQTFSIPEAGITYIPDLSGTSLVALYVSRNKLQTLPNVPATLSDLRAANNSLSTLPASILARNYDLFDVSGNKLDDGIVYPNAFNFNLKDCGFTNPPDLSGLTTTQYLYLDHNALTSAPWPLPSTLRTFSAANNSLTAFPAGFDTLPNLQTVVVDMNKFTDVPTLAPTVEYLYLSDMPSLVTIGTITSTKLSSVTIDRNENLESIASIEMSTDDSVYGSVFVSECPKLHTVGSVSGNGVSGIYMSRNGLTSMPAITSTMIEELEFDYNKISSFDVAGFTAMYSFSAIYNKLTAVPDLPDALEELYLEGNDLKTIPAWVKAHPTLTTIDVTYTNITSIENVLTANLEALYIGNNSIPFIPDLSTSGIVDFNASNNPVLNEFPRMNKNALMWINVHNCNLSVLPDFSDFTVLELVTANNNHITELPGVSPNMRTLYVQDNNLTAIPDLSTSNMRDFNCSNNPITEPLLLDFPLTMLDASATCIQGLPSALMSDGMLTDLKATCTYAKDGGGFILADLQTNAGAGILDYTTDYSACPWLHCPNAQEDPVAPGREEISFNVFGPCRAGYECSGVGPGTPCPVNTYSLGGETTCPNVPVGSYTSLSTRDVLTSCEAGFKCAGLDAPPVLCDGTTAEYQTETGQDDCLTAGDGVYVLDDRTGVADCHAGHYCVAGVEKVCTSGKYQDQTAQSSCSDVPAGSYTNLSTRDVLNVCPENSACAGGDDQPTACSFPTPAGSSVCATGPTCTAGEFVNGTVCGTCPAGTFSNTTNAAECTACETGYASPAGASACQPCAGFGDAQFCKVVEHPEFGTVLVPHTCPEDSYITGDARMECKKCSADYKCDGTTKHEFTLAPFTSVDPTTASGFLTLMAIILVLAGAAGGTMFGISVKKRTQAAKPADNTVIGELIVV